MIDHRAAEILLATAIDFSLAPDEQATLDAHLAGCDRCRAFGAQLRRDSLLLREMPAEHASPTIRTAVEAAVLQSRPQTPRFLLLLAAALLMAMAVGGAIILSGDFFNPDGLVVNPSPSASAPASQEPGIALPTDTLIAYVEASGTTSFIHTIEPDGSNDQTLTEGWSPTWSPDGQSIAYSCPNTEQASDVCVMESDGTAQTVLVSNDNSAFSEPGQWSPSGGQILFIRSGGDSPFGWIANRDGTGVRQLGEGMGSWSPDGTRIMLVRIRTAPPAPPVVSVIRPDGSQLRDLGEGYSATWSPDGRRIAFMVNGELQAYDVADGGVSTLHDRIPGGTLTWVADDLIVIGSEAGLYLVDLRSSEVVELAAGLPIRSTPVVSPDGQWLAFAAAEGDSTDIYLAPVAGGGVIRLTTDGVSASPAWQPVAPASVASPAPPRRPALAYPPETDYGSRATVVVDNLAVHDFAGMEFPTITDLETGTEVFLAAGPLPNEGQDWYQVYFSVLPEDGDQFGPYVIGWVAAGPTGETPDSIRIGQTTCPEVLAAELVGAMTTYARLQCLGTGPVEMSGAVHGCTDGGEPNGSGCLNLRDASETSPYQLWLFFPSDFDTTGLEAWSSVVRAVGHLDDPSSSECGTRLDETATDLDRAWAVLECRGRFVLDEFEVIGQQ